MFNEITFREILTSSLGNITDNFARKETDTKEREHSRKMTMTMTMVRISCVMQLIRI